MKKRQVAAKETRHDEFYELPMRVHVIKYLITKNVSVIFIQVFLLLFISVFTSKNNLKKGTIVKNMIVRNF